MVKSMVLRVRQTWIQILDPHFLSELEVRYLSLLTPICTSMKARTKNTYNKVIGTMYAKHFGKHLAIRKKLRRV